MENSHLIKNKNQKVKFKIYKKADYLNIKSKK